MATRKKRKLKIQCT